jgi:hypothetical protein
VISIVEAFWCAVAKALEVVGSVGLLQNPTILYTERAQLLLKLSYISRQYSEIH